MIRVREVISRRLKPQGYKVVTPELGQGWPQLIMTPAYNGGDTYPPEVTPAAVDQHLMTMQRIGLSKRGKVVAVHWSTDRRLSLRENGLALSAIIDAHPGVTFLALARHRLALEGMPRHGWKLEAHQSEPFLAMYSRTSQLSR